MDQESAISGIENAVRQFADPLTGNITISGVDLQGSGAMATRPSLLQTYIQPILDASTPKQAAEAINLVQRSLMSLQVFQDVSLSIDSNKVVHLNLPAAKRFMAQTGTKFGQSEGSGYFKGSVRNYFGFGEVASIDTSVGTRTRASHMADIAFPLEYKKLIGWRVEALGYVSEKIIDWASHRAQIHGASLRLQNSTQSVGFDAVLRTIKGTKVKPSYTIRENAGHSFKFSLFYNWRKDTRPLVSPAFSGSGYLANARSELSLPPTNFPFLKLAFDFTRGFRVWRDITGSMGSKFGLLIPAGQNDRSHIFDRFNLGGALDVRGFRLNHMGPHDSGDAVGGNALAAFGLSLFLPVPRYTSPNLRLHLFTNAGALTMTPKQLFLSPPNVSAGFGIAYSHPSARFELNVALPLIAHAQELTHKGIQFGVGLEFL